MRGNKNPAKRPEVREKIRQKAQNRTVSEETRKKHSLNNGRYWKGRHVPDHIIKAHADALRGLLVGGKNPGAKAVIMLSKEQGEPLQEFEALADAVRWLHTNGYPTANQSSISACLHGRQKTAYGYR